MKITLYNTKYLKGRKNIFESTEKKVEKLKYPLHVSFNFLLI